MSILKINRNHSCKMHTFQRKKAFLSAVLAVLLTIIVTTVGQAHANLLRSDPADGSVLSESPQEIRLWFDEPISPRFSSVQLFDVDSQTIEVISIHFDPADPSVLIVELPQLPDGVYSMLWKILSEADGHFSQGLLVFGVGEDADLGAATIAPSEDPAPPIQEVLLRWVNFIFLAGIVGSVAMIQLVILTSISLSRYEPQIKAGLEKAGKRMLVLSAWFAALGILVGFGMILWQVTSLKANIPAGVSFVSVGVETITQTRWGYVWSARQVVYLVLSVLLFSYSSRASTISELVSQRRPWFSIGILSLTLIVLQAFSSHASGLTYNTALAIVVDGLHLLAACLWVGGLLSLAFGVLPVVDKKQIGKFLLAGWRPFSFVAGLSVGILIATGLYNTARQVASPDALLTTLYGQSLIMKIGIVLLAGLFGLVNSMLLHPKLSSPLARLLRRPNGWTPFPLRRMPILIAAEVTLGLLVLLSTGMITASPAPRDASFTVTSESVPDSLSQAVDDLIITLNTKPNRPGQNVFTIFASSTRRPPPAEIARVILRFNYLDQELGKVSANAEEIEPGRYLLGGNHFNLAGDWQVEVVVRRIGLEDSIASFSWTVIPPGESRPVVFSKYPWDSILTLAAAALLLFILSLVTIYFVLQNRHPRSQNEAQFNSLSSYGAVDESL
jgi:copper transport protein